MFRTILGEKDVERSVRCGAARGLGDAFMMRPGTAKDFQKLRAAARAYSDALAVHFPARGEPTEDREASYYDDPIKAGIVLAMVWAVFGMFMGVWVAAQLAWPDLAFDGAWSSFGRLRPTHTTGVIFGFGGNALIATSFHVVQRTSRARLAGQVSPWFVLLGFNLFCVLAVSGYLLGVTQSKEYAEAEWYAEL